MGKYISNTKLHKLSRAMSYWLRHSPDKIGIKLSDEGWVSVDELINKSKSVLNFDILFDDIKYVIDNNDKKRFSLKLEDGIYYIRAAQGHSIGDVKIKLEEVIPPRYLYHGTPVDKVDIILKNGIKKMNRNHVHLSVDTETAASVGSRRGDFTILKIEAMRMRSDGIKIYISENGVYLTDFVPPQYIKSII